MRNFRTWMLGAVIALAGINLAGMGVAVASTDLDQNQDSTNAATPATPNGPDGAATPAMPGNPEALSEVEAHRPSMPDIAKPEVDTPEIETPDVQKPDIQRPDVQKPSMPD